MLDRRGFLALAGAGLLWGVTTTGCAGPSAPSQPVSSASIFRAKNEILTYERIDQSKTQLVLAVVGTIDVTNLLAQFVAKHPEVQVVVLDLTGGSAKYRPYLEWVGSSCCPDVMLVGNATLSHETDLFEDLTDRDYASNYDTETILDYAVDGHLYFLPGPRRAQGLLYNETLFDRYGWPVPQTTDDLLALCAQISADTAGSVVPFNLNAKYENEFFCALEAMTYPRILGGTANRAWVHDFKAGTATFSGHMEPLYDLAAKFGELGVLTSESFSYSATTRLKEFSAAGIAMINYDLSNVPTSDSFTFAAVPFPGPTAADPYVIMSSSFWTAMPKKERDDKLKAATESFVGFVSSTEGQQAFIGSRALVGTTTGAKVPDTPSFSGIASAISAGHTFAPEYLVLDGVSDAIFSGASQAKTTIQSMVTGAASEAQALAAVDDAASKARASGGVYSEPAIAQASDDLTILETSNLLADVFSKKAGTSVALVLDDVIYRGNVMRIFKGDITASKVTYLKPRSFDNASTLVSATMTGSQLKAALDDPLGPDDAAADCVYAFAGLKATYLPWASAGSKVRSVSLADGTAIDDGASYSVAFWDGTVRQSHYDVASVKKVDGGFEDILTAYLTETRTIAPAQDGRIELVWE